MLIYCRRLLHSRKSFKPYNRLLHHLNCTKMTTNQTSSSHEKNDRNRTLTTIPSNTQTKARSRTRGESSSNPTSEGKESHDMNHKDATGDDPCWGGPLSHEHDLNYLLNQIYSSNLSSSFDAQNKPLIVSEPDNYIVLNKPPDLRMDGPYLATVHKLLTYWYPAPSLLQQLKSPLSDSPNKNPLNHELVKLVETLPKHNSIPDNILRPCHQLDYATSGILLIATTKEAAAHASRAFEHRATEKIYRTIVHGHVKLDDIPTVSKSNKYLQIWTEGLEEQQYRQKKKNSHRDTFAGFMPIHAIFGKWQAIRKKNKQIKLDDADKDEKSTSIANENKKKRKWNKPVKTSQILMTKEEEYRLFETSKILTVEEESELIDTKWTIVKKNAKYRSTFYQIAQNYNELAKIKHQQTQVSQKEIKHEKEISNNSNQINQHPLPHVFRIEGDDNPSTFYVQASIAQLPDHLNDFRMMLQPSAIPLQYKSCFPCLDTYSTDPESATLNLDYKPAFTKCTLVTKGYYSCNPSHSEIPVSKLELQPLTGRRHQLRLHMVACGHAILGDITYELKNEEMNVQTCPRMCLHAWKLSIPLKKLSIEKSTDHEGGKMDIFVARDPFKMTNKTIMDENNANDKDDGDSNQLYVDNYFC